MPSLLSYDALPGHFYRLFTQAVADDDYFDPIEEAEKAGKDPESAPPAPDDWPRTTPERAPQPPEDDE